jgi:hypothetical protein
MGRVGIERLCHSTIFGHGIFTCLLSKARWGIAAARTKGRLLVVDAQVSGNVGGIGDDGMPHHRMPRCAEVRARNAEANWQIRLVLKARDARKRHGGPSHAGLHGG